jgi:deoxyribonuclease-4
MSLLFGPAGVPHASKERSTVGGVKAVKELGLDAMEVQFVRGVKMSELTAKNVGTVAKSLSVALSVHAPYYINLNAGDEKKRKESIQRLIDSLRIGSIFYARNIVFHAGYYLKSSKEKAYQRIKEGIKAALEFARQHGIDVVLRPETTGKPTQFGELDELLRLSSELDGVIPCVDFSHIYARYRTFNSYGEFYKILEKVESISKEALKDMHMHVSGIEYGLKGEKSHLNLKNSDFRYRELLKALRDFKVEGMLICESPNLEEDALMLKGEYGML